MKDIILQIINGLLGTLVSIGVGYAILFLKRSIALKELTAKKSLVQSAVLFAEQTYKYLDGEGKFAQAESWLIDRVVNLGIKVDKEEIKGLIDSTVKKMKEEIVSQISTMNQPIEKALSNTQVPSDAKGKLIETVVAQNLEGQEPQNTV